MGMAVGEKQRRKMPSFSSSLLDAVYHSIDHPMDHLPPEHPRRYAANQVDEDIQSLRRAIMVEKWMESYTAAAKSRHLPSNSASSTDSSIFTSSETESSASRPAPKPPVQKANSADRPEKTEGRFTRTKLRALKIYGDLKKAKEPISPGGRVASFLNSIFSPRKSRNVDEWGSVRKSRSMKDTATCSLASRECLSKNPNSSRSNKSKRSVRFCPVTVIVDEYIQPSSHNRIHDGDEHSTIGGSMLPSVSSQFIKKNIDSFRQYDGKKHEFRKFYENGGEFDDKSCCSSDLFELENIGANDEELPVYGTTDLKMNRAIASGLIV